MFKLLLITIVVVPVVLGMVAARAGDRRRGVVMMLALVALYDVLYVAMLYYVRIRWVGWGASAG